MTKNKTKLRRMLLFAAAIAICGMFFLPRGGMPPELWLWAKAHGLSPSDYPQSLVALYRRNEDARAFVKYYPLREQYAPEIDLSGEISPGAIPLLIQWDERWGYRSYNENLMGLAGCGPTCMSMAAIYLKGDPALDPWAMAQYAELNGYNVVGSGTSWSYFSEGAEGLGLDSTQIPVDQQRILENLNAGNPIVCVVGPGDFTTEGHFILFVGQEDGKIQIHDPNSISRSERLWDFETLAPQIQALWVLRKG